MPDKQRGDVDFIFPEGLFKDTAIISPVQLYQLFEIEIANKKTVKSAVYQNGLLMIFCMLGKGHVQVGNESFQIEKDSALILPADRICTIFTAEKGEGLRCVCVNFYCDPLRDRSVNRPFYSAFSSRELTWLVEDLCEVRHNLSLLIAELCYSRASFPLVRSFLDCILVNIYRNHISREDDPLFFDASVTAVGHTVYAVIRYIDEHLYSMNNLMEMAQELGYSYNYLSHLFRKKTGMTIQAYVSRKKIERSTEFLSQPQYSITEIAAMLNYDCIQSFSKAFKKSMNMSPTEYRAMHGFDE